MKIIKNFLLVLVSIVIMLVLAEVVLSIKNLNMKNYDIEMWKYSKELKIKDPQLGHEHVKSKCATLQSVEICLDEHGLREEKIDLKFNGRNVLFLGSSITLGWGLENNQIMTTLIKNEFDKIDSNTQVINAGIGNYNTVRYVERFLTKLQYLKPTDIVVHYFINDSEQLSSGNNSFLLRHSQLAATSWMVYQKLLMSLQQKNLVDHYSNAYSDENPGFKAMKESLKKLSVYAKKNNINLYLAMTPDIHFLEDYPFTNIHKKMGTVATELGYKFIDLYPSLKGKPFADLQVMQGDAHPNSLGHQIMADTIYKEIK